MVKLHSVDDRSDEEAEDPFFQENHRNSVSRKGINDEPFITHGSFSSNRRNADLDNFNTQEPELGEDNRCGIGCFSPDWMQVFASKKAFIAIFSILAVIQGMSWSYFTATITTLEKRFKISSQTTGIVMTGNEISQILFSVVLAYYGGRAHRPRWIALGVMFSAISCFLLASPHFFYGPGTDALSLTEDYHHLYDTSNHSSSFFNNGTKSTSSSSMRSKVQLCQRDSGMKKKAEGCDISDVSIVPLILIFISQFVSGIGVLLFFSLGGPYLDDNMKKTKSPMMFGITMSLRLIGPTFGFVLASQCLKIFISPTLKPYIDNKDPRWLGAWWLGWVVLGTAMAVTSLFIAMFPRELPRAAQRKKLAQTMAATEKMQRAGSQLVLTAEAVAEAPLPKLKEIPQAVKALLTNKINILNNLAGVFYIFSALGYWSFAPKYLETIFMQDPVTAAVTTGIVGIFFQAVGLLSSGFLISKYQPSARKLAGWNVIISLAYVLVKITFTQLGCKQGDIQLGNPEATGRAYNLTTECNVDCQCKVNKMFAVCYKEENQVFYSACHAGCASNINGTISDCSCLPSPSDTVTLGPCNKDCFYMFTVFVVISGLIKLADGSGRIGNMLVSYRCVDPKDKSLSIGLSIFLVSILAMLPSPILFGAIIDSVCLVWGTKCGKRGNCWVYDGERLRYVFNLTAAAFTFVGALFDCAVWYYVKDLDLYDEDKNVQMRAESQRKGKEKEKTSSGTEKR